MFRFSFRFNCNASLIACITRRCSAQLLFSLLYRFAQCSFLIDRSFPAEICTSPFFSPPFHLSLSHSVNAPGCSLHVVAQTRRLSISIRSSLRLLCNLSTADVVTWSEREPTVGPSGPTLFSPIANFPSQFRARAAATNGVLGLIIISSWILSRNGDLSLRK